MSITTARNHVAARWSSLAAYVAVLLGLTGLLIYRLDTIMPGYSLREVATMHASLDAHALLHNPINAPFLLLEHVFSALNQHGLIWGRALSVGCGLVVLTVFCGLLRYWHTKATAILGTILLGTSSWFLHTVRLGTPDVLVIGLFLIVACGVWLKATQNRWALLILFILGGSLLYVPGMMWLVGLGILWQWKLIDKIFKECLTTITIGGLVFLAILTPLALAAVKDPHLIKVIAGLPAQGWPQPLHAIGEILRVPYHIFVHGPLNPELNVGRAPLLDVFSVVMAVFGFAVYARHATLRRSKLFAAIFILAAILIGLGGMNPAVMLPFLYLFVAAGVMYLLQQWLTVFPRNPIAQGLGYGMLGLVIALSCVYNLRAYFVAWPATPAAQTTFMQQRS